MNEDFRPVVRAWVLRGGDIGGPEIDAVLVDMPERLEAIPGYLGLIVTVDRTNRLLRAVSFWKSPEARDRSTTFALTTMRDALKGLDAHILGPWDFEVAYNRFRTFAQRLELLSGRQVVVRLVQMAGGQVAEEPFVSLLRDHIERAVIPTPGCEGVLVLVDPDAPALVGGFFWVDAETADRTERVGNESLTAFTRATSSWSSTVERHEVLLNKPITDVIR